MKRWLASIPIRAKLLLIVGVATGFALIMASTVIVSNDYRGARHALVHRMQAQADIAAIHSSGAVAFDDEIAATRMLVALGADHAIVAVELDRADGTRLARQEFPDRTRGDAELVEVSAAVVLDQRIGTLRLSASPDEINADLARDVTTLVVALVIALGVALLIAVRLQRIVSVPILALVDAASRVSRSRDYSLRVATRGTDEVGQLVDEFNHMLGEIEERDRQVNEHAAELEAKVTSRTAELAAALKAAQAATGAKAEFLANMSHEIRTPMNGVVGMLDLLHAEKLDDQARSMVDTARNSADALLTLINDVLDFSKIDAGKLTLERIDIELRPLTEEIATLFSQHARARGVEMFCAIHSNVPAVMGGDPTRLRQIMTNLVGNAVKFTEAGEVFVGIQVRDEPAAPGSKIIQILVQDSGIGMTAEATARLFGAFTQADMSTTRKYGGTGLGLAITKRLVDAMGGTVRVWSEPGKGTTFSVFLPLEVRSVPGTAQPSVLQGLKALVIGAHPISRCILEHYLAAENMQPLSVASPRQGLEEARAAAGKGAPYDVVLLDFEMSLASVPAAGAHEMDGIAFLRALRADPTIALTKCVVLSSLGDRAEDRELDTEALGISAWLTKPVHQAQLQYLLATITGRGDGVDPVQLPPIASRVVYRGIRTLLVEDNLVNQEVARRMLRTFGIEAVVAFDGAQAVTRLQAESFDLVLMDCQMPVMDGYEATAAVRAWEEEAGRARMPIIAMTANALHGDRERCLAAGMDDYISKPIKRDVLAAALARWLTPDAPPLGETVLDAAAIAQLAAIMEDDLSEVINTYLADIPVQFASMARAIAERDPVVLRRSGHSMKSSSRSVGALAVGRIAESIEALCVDDMNFAEAENLVATLRAAFQVVEPKLREIAVTSLAGKHVSSAATLSGGHAGDPTTVKKSGGP